MDFKLKALQLRPGLQKSGAGPGGRSAMMQTLSLESVRINSHTVNTRPLGIRTTSRAVSYLVHSLFLKTKETSSEDKDVSNSRTFTQGAL